MPKVFLRKKITNRIANGHPWIFKNEIGDIEGEINNGCIVDVFSSNGAFVGRGYFNVYAQLAIRLFTHNVDENIDDNFFLHKIKNAKSYREQLGFTDTYRLIFSEADDLPGLIIDKYNDYFVVQISTFGMEQWKNAIINALNTVFQPKGIYERNDINQRLKEGLSIQKGFLSTSFETKLLIEENDLRILVDIENGTKTGYFLDQRNCKLLLKDIVLQTTVLDVFSYTGSFMINAAKFGATKVVGVEESERNVNLAKENLTLNGFTSVCEIIKANPFDTLNKLVRDKKKFDVVILNPPPFATNSKQIPKALSAYKELNLRALQLLQKGGYLLSISNSNVVSEEMFKSTIMDAALDANKCIAQIAVATQSVDHPILWQIPETAYLNCYLLKVK